MKSSGKHIMKWLVMSLLTLAVAAEAKPVTVTGSVDRNEMAVGDTFTFTIEISSDTSLNVNDPSLPDLSGFELINQWSGVESRSTFANGTFEVVQSRTFNYMLASTKAGTFRLGPATVVVEGQSYQTQPIAIRVLAGRAGPPQAGNQPPDTFEEVEDIFNQLLRRHMGNRGGTRTQPVNPEEAFFIQVEVDKTKVYVGEQVTASWYLYTRGQIHDIDTLKYPSLNGFWKEEIELATRLNFQQEVVNGIVYQKALLASYALFPIKAGQAAIDPYKAKCTVSVPSALGFSRPYQFTKSSKPIAVQVVEVPTDNRPANYTGAVGQFNARALVNQTTVAAHQPLIYKLRFEGRGNAKLIDLPVLNLPAGIEVYDTKNDAKFFREGTSFKEFELSLIPRTTGAVTLPQLAIAAFNPATAEFYEVKTDPVVFNVLPGVAPQARAGVAETGRSGAARPMEPTLPPLSLELAAAPMTVPLPMPVVWALAYAIVVILLAWRYLVLGELMRQKRDLGKVVRRRLDEIKRQADSGDWRGVGVKGTNLIYFLLGQLSGQGGAGQQLDKLLLEAPPSVRRELTNPATKLLQILELLSFAPENLIGAKKEKSELKVLAKELGQFCDQALALAEASDHAEAAAEQKA